MRVSDQLLRTGAGITLALLLSTHMATGATSVVPIQAPVTFTKNCGQWDSDVLFRSDAGGAVLWFTRTGIIYQFGSPNRTTSLAIEDQAGEKVVSRDAPDPQTYGIIAVRFVDASANSEIQADGLMAYKCHYFQGNDPAQWVTDVPNYTGITYSNIYPGVDLRYFGTGTQVEYAFELHSGADVRDIRLSFRGATALSIDDAGQLLINTPYGLVRETAPVLYQQEGTLRYDVAGGFYPVDDCTVGFRVDGPICSDLALVIDPKLEFSTLVEGAACYDVDIDGDGNIFLTGSTTGGLYLANAYDPTYNGNIDAFVTKVDASGTGLLYSTYIGGTGVGPSAGDDASSIAIDASGRAVITGTTTSPDFPIVNAFDNTLGGRTDAFVLRLSADGSSIDFSTYLGGSDSTCTGHGCSIWHEGDFGYGIALDPAGGIYTAGYTESGDFPLKNAYQSEPATYYVAKISPDGDSLIYSTYFGGTDLPQWSIGVQGRYWMQLIAVDTDGSAVLSGYALHSQGFPFVDPLDSSFNCTSACGSAFVTKFAPTGDSVVFSTLVKSDSSCGSTSVPTDVKVDGDGNIVICGDGGCEFPLVNAWDSDNVDDGFVLKLAGDGQSIIFSTYVGGDGEDELWRMALDADNNIYVTGWTIEFGSFTYPVVNSDTYGSCDAIGYAVPVTKLTSTGGVDYSLYIPGGTGHYGTGIAVDESRGVVVAGWETGCPWPLRNSFDGRHDSTVAAGILMRLVDGGIDCDCPQDGDIHSDCADDVLDMGDLIDYLFAGGAQPPIDGPLCPHIDRGDYNCDGQDDALDLAELIDHVFGGGPCPCDPCSCISYPDDCPGLTH